MIASTPREQLLPFSYVVNAVLPASGSVTQTLVLGQDSDFVLYGFEAATSEDAVTNSQKPDNFTVLIEDQSTGKALSSEPLRRSLVAGNALNNFVAESAVRWPRANQFRFTFTNLTAQTLTVQFVMKGYKQLGGL
jgi:hypothetical protein